MNRKYVLCLGYVVSGFDNKEHYVSEIGLADLYGVKLQDCILETSKVRTDASVTYLRPRANGGYLEWLRDNG